MSVKGGKVAIVTGGNRGTGMAKREEIAGGVAFLASDQSSDMTSTTVVADRGMMQPGPGL